MLNSWKTEMEKATPVENQVPITSFSVQCFFYRIFYIAMPCGAPHWGFQLLFFRVLNDGVQIKKSEAEGQTPYF